MMSPGEEILFTRQRHDAKRAGLHWDYRMVSGDKAYSWATKKPMPDEGKSILLFEQPVHTKSYALSDNIVIPDGSYGAGTTTLDWVRKAHVGQSSTPDKLTLHVKGGNSFLLRKLPEGKYGDKAWLFRNLGKNSSKEEEGAVQKGSNIGTHSVEKKASLNQYLEKLAVVIKLYWDEKDNSKRKWIAPGKTPPKGFVDSGVTFHNMSNASKQKRKNKFITKIAESYTKATPTAQPALAPHQIKALQKLQETHGVILDHSTGSGKTKTFLTAAQNIQAKDPNARVLIVAPASLQKNVDKEIKKHGLKIDPKRLDVYSYERATNQANEIAKRHYALAIADEAHKLRNTNTKRTRSLKDIIQHSDNRILATATPNYNRLSDISSLLNMANGHDVMPENPNDMENRYLKTIAKKRSLLQYVLGQSAGEEQVLDHKDELKSLIKKHVSYYDSKEDPAAKEHFPTQTSEVIETPMSEKQEKMYHYVEGDLPFWIRYKIRNNLPLDKKEKGNLNAFSSGVRQVSDSLRPYSVNPDTEEYSPKIEAAVGKLKAGIDSDKNFKGLVYSNYLGAGLNEYSRKLNELGVKHNLYDGSLSADEKERMVKEYNTGKTPVLLVSSSGAEGLDLKGTKKVQLLEGHWNKSKLKQVIGRGNRYKSHDSLPPNERKVHVEQYQSVFKKPLIGKAPYSIDKYLAENSDGKEELFNQVKDLMRQNGQ